MRILLASDSGIRKALRLRKPDRNLLSVDGKVMRGTGRKGGTIEEIKDLQVLNVYDQGSETCLFSEAIEDKTNEIPHAQKILAEIALDDTVVTFDAMHMQKETVRIISEGKGDYVGGLKGNQGTLNDFAGSVFTEGNLRKLESLEGCFHKTTGKSILFLYDFGDEWRFSFRLLKKIDGPTYGCKMLLNKMENPVQYPTCNEDL